jgi:hypothetical protein
VEAPVSRPENNDGFDPSARNDAAAILYRLAQAGGAAVLSLGNPAPVSRALSALDHKKVTCAGGDARALDGEASAHGLETFVVDLAAPGWHEPLEGRTYDVVILADLLEHLRDPERVLRDLREQRLLADDSRLLVSFANVAHQSVANELLSGECPRIRWYTARSMARLLGACGYLIVETHRTCRTGIWQADADTDVDTETYEYVLLVRPSAAAPQLALLHQRLDETARRADRSEALRDQLSALLEEERAEFRDQLSRGADELERMQEQLARTMGERSSLRDEAARLHRRLARLQDELAVAGRAKRAATLQLRAVEQSRSYRWSRRLARLSRAAAGIGRRSRGRR